MGKMTPTRVVFYQLSIKFLERVEGVQKEPKQLLHQTLALGHHIGVIDCFAAKLDIPYDKYAQWVGRLPDGQAHKKLGRLLHFGEIEIGASHAGPLLEALKAGLAGMSAEEAEWTEALSKMLQAIVEEPALYLMVRQRT